MARIEVRAEVTGKVWKLEAAPGGRVEADEPLMLIESMKMEIPVTCDRAVTVVEFKVAEGDPVEDGQVVAIAET